MASQPFRFKKFSVEQAGAAHPVGTDGVLLGAWADVESCHNILDIGTGTGVVALMLAQRINAFSPFSTPPPTPPLKGRGDVACSALPSLLGEGSGVGLKEGRVTITAVEIHPPSAALARRNFAASPWAEQLELVESSVQDFAQNADRQFDMIVSNPPFFSETTVSPDTTRRLGRHTTSLSPGELLAVSKKLLTENGRLCVVLPVQEGRRLCELAVPNGLYWTEEVEVFSRPEKPAERLLLRFERNPYRFVRKKLSIFAGAVGQGYSSDFREFTEGFYL